jgi:hypothetical protein
MIIVTVVGGFGTIRSRVMGSSKILRIASSAIAAILFVGEKSPNDVLKVPDRARHCLGSICPHLLQKSSMFAFRPKRNYIFISCCHLRD